MATERTEVTGEDIGGRYSLLSVPSVNSVADL